jgi:hypothetical protein
MPTLEKRRRFRNRLTNTIRWYEAAKILGLGIFCFMPHNVVTNN